MLRIGQNLQYAVPRTRSGALCVYTDIRNGGTREIVLVRRVLGNIQALASDLRQKIPEGKVEVKSGGTVWVSGRSGVSREWKQKVVEWLEAKGF